MKLYAELPSQRTRQVLVDALLALWCLLAVWAGITVHNKLADAEGGARRLESGSDKLAGNMRDAADSLGDIPLAGSAVRKPFDAATSTGHDLAQAGHDLAASIGRVALWLGLLTAVLPILCALLLWGLTRLRWVRRAGRLAALRNMPGGERVLALQSLQESAPSVLARVSDDPVGAWQEGDVARTRALADAVLRESGLRGLSAATARKGRAGSEPAAE